MDKSECTQMCATTCWGKVLARNVWGWLRGCWWIQWLCKWVLDVTKSPGKIHGSGGVGTKGTVHNNETEWEWEQIGENRAHMTNGGAKCGEYGCMEVRVRHGMMGQMQAAHHNAVHRWSITAKQQHLGQPAAT